METSKTSTGQQSYDLTSFAADIHASLSAQQENDKAKPTQDTYGPGSENPLASYDPDTQSWKMYGDTSLWGEPQSLASLPPSGMTQNGVLYQQPAWAQITDVIESLLWPTPTTQEVEHPEAVWNKKGRRVSPNGNTHSMGLADAVNLWPTPTASSWGNEGSRAMLDKKIAEGCITEQDKRAMTAGNGGKLNPTWVEWLMGFPTGWTDLEA